MRAASTARLRTLNEADERLQTVVVVPPDGGWGWIVIMASFYINLVNNGLFLTFGIFLETFVKEFNTTKGKVSISTSIFQLCFFFIGPVVSGLANRYGFRLCAMIGAVISSSGYFLVSMEFVTLPSMYFFHGCMAGLGSGFVFIPAVLAVGFYFERWRALATGLAVSGSGVGTIMWPYIISRLLEHYHWREVLKIVSGIESTCILAALLFRPLKPKIVTDAKVSAGLKSRTALRRRKWWQCCESCYGNKEYPTMRETLEGKDVKQATKGTLSYHGEDMDENAPIGWCAHLQLLFAEKICCCCFCCRNKKDEITAQRPLYRDDIFFETSLTRIPQYNTAMKEGAQPGHAKDAQKSLENRTKYAASVTRVATMKDVYYDENACRLCPQSVTRIISTMLDITLLQSPSFLLLSTSSVFAELGCYIPYVYFISRGLDHNLAETDAAWLLSLIGMSNTVGRVGIGLIASLPCLNGVYVSCFSLSTCGTILLINEMFDSLYMMYITSLVYGFFIASIASLKSLIIVELMGLSKLTNAFGLLVLFQGIGSSIGIPIGGFLRDKTNSYFATFIFGGTSLLTGGLLLIPLKAINRIEKQKAGRI